MPKLKVILVIALMMMFSLTSYAGEKIRIGWVYAMANAPVLVANEKGYFKEQGIDVEIKEFKSGPLLHQALSAGELDMAYIGAPPVYHWFSRGLESRILAKVNYGQAAVISRKDSGVNQLSDLKNKKMAGVRKGSGMDVLLRGYVLGDAAKLKPDTELEIVSMPTGNMDSAVDEKVVNAAFIWEPFTSQSLIRGNTQLIFDMNKAVPKYPWYIVMAMPDTLKNKRTEVIKVLRAHKQAVEYLNSKPNAGNGIIAKAFNLGEVTDVNGKKHGPTEIVAMARERLGWEYELKKEDMEFIQRLMNYSYELGFIKKRLTVEEIVDNSFMQEAIAMK
ncbi:MAG: MetQ/NlpA family ABC transporter substrate-binding protein [Gammaproteobacteria bacterium]|nr:MetQ/NlpA family ABC transporter substrate-binding protein [Gammaproteobacteria bacterium]